MNPGATGVADLRVPGGATAWTITSGNATGYPGSGIALDSRDGDIAGGGLALTVGSDGGNLVNIRQHSTRVNDGSNNNNGIVVNNQFTGASTTTVTVGAGVTIGTNSVRMNRNGIRARIWLGSGAATFINHAEIHSTLEGIDVIRGDSADTNAATTITNSGAISAGRRGIYLRYLAGDTTGGGGNTAAVTTGNAKITNSGVITKHAGTGSDGAIDLNYERGHGAAEVDNSGAITATASGVTMGYGIRLQYQAAAGTGDATITNTAAIASKQHAIFLENAGAGASTITNSGALTAQNSGQSGISLLDTGSAGAVTVTNSGDVTSTATGIEVRSRNKNAAGPPAGVSITHSDGDIEVSAGGGILAVVGEAGGGAPVNTGDAVIMVTGGSVESSGTIVEAKNFEAGDIDIAVSEGVTLTSTDQHGIFAELHADNTAGGVTIDHAGTVTGPKTGIYVRRQAPTGAGDISVTNSGHIKKTGDRNWIGLLIEDKGRGAVTVTNSGDIGEEDLKHQQGIVATKSGAAGGVTITNSGAVITGGRGIVAIVSSEGEAAVNTGVAKLDVTGGSVTARGVALEAKNEEAGNVDIDVAAGVTLTSERDHGIFAELTADNTAGEVDIEQAGTITSYKTGIYVRRCEDDYSCASNGAIRITNRGDIKLSRIHGSAWMGILVEERGRGAVTVNNSGDIVGTDGSRRHDHGILVQGKHEEDVGAGAFTVTNSGDLTAKLYGIWVPVSKADRRIRIDHSGAITGRKGIFAQVGRFSAEGETRAAADQPVIDVVWADGAFSHGTETQDSDTPRFKANSYALAVSQDPEVEVERIVRGRDHGSAVGIEAQVMSWLQVTREVARGDDQEIADKAAQDLLLRSPLTLDPAVVDPAVRARAQAIVAQFRAALQNTDLIVPSLFTSDIDTDNNDELSENRDHGVSDRGYRRPQNPSAQRPEARPFGRGEGGVGGGADG